MPTPLETIRALEERAFNAWPALETIAAEGWLCRFAGGYTKRANSVNALAPAVPVPDILRIAAPLYAARALPLVFRLSPLAGPEADAALAALGFQFLDASIVMTAPVQSKMAGERDVSIAARPQTAWSAGFAAANRVAVAHRETHDRMLAAIQCPTAFAALESEERPIAWGLGVTEHGMVGLFDIVTAPEARRQGAARSLVRALLAWGYTQDARAAYLQVVASNAPAIALYRSLGFVEAYRYHYRVRPL